jgi:hypothetical protein
MMGRLDPYSIDAIHHAARGQEERAGGTSNNRPSGTAVLVERVKRE